MNGVKRSIATTDGRVTVIGAGVAGLTTATLLANRGHWVRIFEQAPEIAEVGAGIQISPNGCAVLNALGLGAQLEERSLRASAVRLIDGSTGHEVASLNLAHHAPDLHWRFIHRADLIDVLRVAALAAGVEIVLNKAATPPSDGTPFDGDALLVGADGLKSVTRTTINGMTQPFFTGQVAWRAVVADQWSGPKVAEVHMGAGRHLVTYPLSEGRRNIVAVEERTEWQEEGWHLRGDPDDLRRAFSTFDHRARNLLAQVSDCHLWGLFRHPVAEHWHKGAQVLVGDAAHPTLPFLAQGANMALEDAWVLANSLDDLGAYERARKPRVTRAIEAANANARNYHLSGLKRIAAHTALRIIDRTLPGQLLSRYDWLYRHDVTR